jgi:hypothetical protein
MKLQHRPLCQASGCHSLAARAVEIDLPAAWEATQNYTTMTVVAGLCCKHGQEVARRVQAVLEARSDLYNLLVIVEAAAGVERDLRQHAERAAADADRIELEAGSLRQQLQDTEAALRVARRDGRRLAAAGDAA